MYESVTDEQPDFNRGGRFVHATTVSPMSFFQALSNMAQQTTTENGATTYNTTQSEVLNLFAQGGALRNADESKIRQAVNLAAGEDLELALKCIFYLRDIRGGQGERRFFRIALNELAKTYPDAIKKNIQNIPRYGRYDDIWLALGTTDDVKEFVTKQLISDSHPLAQPATLLAKWMPSINTSSKATRKLAKTFAQHMKLTDKQYRKLLSRVRAQLKLTETYMCKSKWQDIKYQSVPSRAAMIYRKAFAKHDEPRYTQYLTDVKTGKTKIKAATLYPYDICNKLRNGQDPTLEAQWQALPNYIDKPGNYMVLCDSSASMDQGSPKAIDVATSLTLYITERNKGRLNGLFMTFQDQPRIVQLRGTTTYDKLQYIRNAPWGGSTNLQAAFNQILLMATKWNLPQSELPDTLFIISDMEFNTACKDNSMTNFQAAQQKFEAAGYKLPEIVFWNVMARNENVPVQKDQRGAFLVSGCSPSIMKAALNKKATTPYEMMLEVINSPRYAQVTA